MTIPAIVTACQAVNPTIGNYVRHVPLEVFAYSIQVTNGRMRCSVEDEQDPVLSDERIRAIAATFIMR